jgi:hypothetical protein
MVGSESEFFSDSDPSKSFGFFRIRIRNTAGNNSIQSLATSVTPENASSWTEPEPEPHHFSMLGFHKNYAAPAPAPATTPIL